MKNIEFEYVASGFSYFRINGKDRLTPDLIDFFKKTFCSINDTLNHKVSLLYNAYTEKNHGEMFRDTLKPLVHHVHADSGGLQMITLGKTITDELKEDVYANQAKYSDIAMAFDVIPVKVLGEKSVRLDTKTRLFDAEKHEECAKESGKNLRRQIEYFLEQKTSTRPFLIAQGNCYETYMKWVEIMLKQLPKNYVECIGGIAMGAAALGKGPLEDIKRAFYFTQLPISLKENHLHLLGVGAFPRMIPTLNFVQNGLYNNMTISYDSTTHTASITRGLYFYKVRMLNYSRVMGEDYITMYNDIGKNFPGGVYEYPVEVFHACLNAPTSVIEKKYGSSDPSAKTAVAYISSAIKNFCSCVNHMALSRDDLLKFLPVKEKNTFVTLYDVKTLKDFNCWLKDVGKYVESDSLDVYNKYSNLESLFGD
jgi:hypothetical protein